MLKKFYFKYLARNKVFRHVYQHFEIMLISAFIIYIILEIPLTFPGFLLLLFFTYLPDVDGISSTFIWYRSNPIAKGVADRLLQGKMRDALSFGTIYHKQLNRLMLHNIIIYFSLWYFYYRSIIQYSNTSTIALSGLLGHFTFDLVDDIFQLGHIKNWLWPFHLLFPKWHFFDPDRISYPIPQMYKYMTAEPVDYLLGNGEKAVNKS